MKKKKQDSRNIIHVIILHGKNCSAEMFWYPYIKQKLETRGYIVWVPDLPNTTEARLHEWLPYVLKNGNIDENTILIGHSSGAALILSILEQIPCKIKQAILVSGFLELESAKSILKESYNWDKIKSSVDDIIFMNSDNDPYGCDDKEGRKLFNLLGGTMIIRHGEGHMGSIKYKQSYDDFPFLLQFIE